MACQPNLRMMGYSVLFWLQANFFLFKFSRSPRAATHFQNLSTNLRNAPLKFSMGMCGKCWFDGGSEGGLGVWNRWPARHCFKWENTHTHARTHTHTHARACARAQTHTYTHIHAHIHTYIHTLTYTHVDYTHIHTRTYTHTRARTYTHTHSHTHTRTHARARARARAQGEIREWGKVSVFYSDRCFCTNQNLLARRCRVEAWWLLFRRSVWPSCKTGSPKTAHTPCGICQWCPGFLRMWLVWFLENDAFCVDDHGVRQLFGAAVSSSELRRVPLCGYLSLSLCFSLRLEKKKSNLVTSNIFTWPSHLTVVKNLGQWVSTFSLNPLVFWRGPAVGSCGRIH